MYLIQLGEEARHVGETNMNERSSRSHTVFRIVLIMFTHRLIYMYMDSRLKVGKELPYLIKDASQTLVLS